MPPVLDDETTKLHVVDGTVWYAKHEYVPVNSEMSVLQFLSEHTLVNSGMRRSFRLLGVPANAELITALYVRFNRGDVRSVNVAGPNILTDDDNTWPESIFIQMRNCFLPAACGGWHQVSLLDYPTYALSARLQKNGFFYDEAAETYLKLHPVFNPASFVGTLNYSALSQLLVSLIDPRWYSDTQTSEVGKKLKLFCGLTPSTQKRVMDSSRIIARRREQLCRLVFDCWHTAPVNKVDLADPKNFLYRIKIQHEEDWRGDLRASQKFLDFVSLTWQQALNPVTTDPLFLPSSFFFSAEETEAYNAHILARKKGK